MRSTSLPVAWHGLQVFGHDESSSSVLSPTRFERGVILLLITFLVIFPKGGIKAAGVPITWGYIGLALAFLWFLLTLFSGRPGRIRVVRLIALAALVPFQAVAWTSLLVNGVNSVGFTISLVVTFFAIPAILVLAFGIHLDRLDLGFIFRLLRRAVFAVAAYGIFLFVYKILTGEFIEIPYLTVNAGDAGSMEATKYNNRGGIFKLISTYNNGNIYGVTMLTLLPLYVWLEKSVVKRSVVKLSLVLTLSRTVWVGLLFYEVLHRLYTKRISTRTLLMLGATLTVMALGVVYLLGLVGMEVSFLFDRNLGGRVSQFDTFGRATVLPATSFDAIAEIVYLSVLQNFGALGLFFFLVGMITPVIAHLVRALPFAATEYKKSLATGLMVYLFVAMSDGAILFIPVMAIYWFVVSLLLSDNPSFADRHAGTAVQDPAPDRGLHGKVVPFAAGRA